MRKLKGQTLIEYTMIVAVSAMTIMAMSVLMKRGIQSVVKVVADQLAYQNEAEEDYKEGSGYLINAYAVMRAHQDSEIDASGEHIKYWYGDALGGGSNYTTQTSSETLVNLGFIKMN